MYHSVCACVCVCVSGVGVGETREPSSTHTLLCDEWALDLHPPITLLCDEWALDLHPPITLLCDEWALDLHPPITILCACVCFAACSVGRSMAGPCHRQECVWGTRSVPHGRGGWGGHMGEVGRGGSMGLTPPPPHTHTHAPHPAPCCSPNTCPPCPPPPHTHTHTHVPPPLPPAAIQAPVLSGAPRPLLHHAARVLGH